MPNVKLTLYITAQEADHVRGCLSVGNDPDAENTDLFIAAVDIEAELDEALKITQRGENANMVYVSAAAASEDLAQRGFTREALREAILSASPPPAN